MVDLLVPGQFGDRGVRSSISRHLNARATALIIALSGCWHIRAALPGAPIGTSTTFLPPRLRIANGTRTVDRAAGGRTRHVPNSS